MRLGAAGAILTSVDRTKAAARRRGATLLDVAAGSMLLAVMLIPSAHLISQSQSCNARLAIRQTMLFEAENQLEATKIALSNALAFDLAWATATIVLGITEEATRTRIHGGNQHEARGKCQ